MIKEAIKLLSERENLDDKQTEAVLREIMEGEASAVQIAAFLTTLKMKGETDLEISSAASVMREKAVQLNPKVEKLIDTCGTGGDNLQTFNISTLVSLTISAYGVAVAKHGNRSVSSSCGSADLIEALGIPLLKDKNIIERGIEEVGFGYIFAPYFHPAMKFAMPVRKELGIRTIFNILGPLANPAKPKYQILGVYSKDLISIVIKALKTLGLRGALVFHAQDGMDEISISANSDYSQLKKGDISEGVSSIEPSRYGIKKADLEVLKVSSLEESLSKARKVISGEDSPELDIVALNTGWALYVLEEAADSIEGFKKAKDLLLGKKVLEKLNQLKDYYRNVSTE
ncbi:MAG: anthranilate phosphoribosyltransferase [Candidatus Kaelpia aquatica]|nr:anthranilate phosphoribosyltransferase [Candidatus Kaelpia aquatica]